MTQRDCSTASHTTAPAQHSTAQHSTAWHDTAQHGMTQHSIAWEARRRGCHSLPFLCNNPSLHGNGGQSRFARRVTACMRTSRASVESTNSAGSLGDNRSSKKSTALLAASLLILKLASTAITIPAVSSNRKITNKITGSHGVIAICSCIGHDTVGIATVICLLVNGNCNRKDKCKMLNPLRLAKIRHSSFSKNRCQIFD